VFPVQSTVVSWAHALGYPHAAMTETPRRRSIVTSARRLWAAVVISGVSANTSAQMRPAIPEVRCTGVSLVVTRTPGRRDVGLRVVNTDPGDFQASLRPEIEVLHEVGGRWQRVSVAGLLLRSACTSEPRAWRSPRAPR
jgi:hypothetical protein